MPFFDKTCSEALSDALAARRNALSNAALGNDPELGEDPSDEERKAHDDYELAQERLLAAEIAVEDARLRQGCL